MFRRRLVRPCVYGESDLVIWLVFIMFGANGIWSFAVNLLCLDEITCSLSIEFNCFWSYCVKCGWIWSFEGI